MIRTYDMRDLDRIARDIRERHGRAHRNNDALIDHYWKCSQAFRDRGFFHAPQQSMLLGGGGFFQLTYTGATSGFWRPVVGGNVVFVGSASDQTWTFTVNQFITLTVKGCGAGGYGLRLISGTYLNVSGSGGGGAYHLGFSFGTLNPGTVYELTLGTHTLTQGAYGSQTILKIQGGATVLQLGAGQTAGGTGTHGFGSPNSQNRGLGGTSATGGGSSGGNGQDVNGLAGSASSGTGGGGAGGTGNIGGTGGFAGQNGYAGESAAGTGEAPGSHQGGDGGFGGGIIINGSGGYGRGAGGSGEDDSTWDGSLKGATYVYHAGQSVVQFTR